MTQEKLVAQASLVMQLIKSDTQLQRQLDNFGYDVRRIKEGEKFCEDARNITEQYEEAQRQSKGAMLSLRETRAHIQERYMKQLEIARVALREVPQVGDILVLKANQPRRLDLWLKQTDSFYHNALQHVDVLQSYGIRLHEMEEIKTLVGQMIELSGLQKLAESRLQLLAVKKQETLFLLEDWYQNLTELARTALKDTPEQLEAFGITVKA